MMIGRGTGILSLLRDKHFGGLGKHILTRATECPFRIEPDGYQLRIYSRAYVLHNLWSTVTGCGQVLSGLRQTFRSRMRAPCSDDERGSGQGEGEDSRTLHR